MPVPVVIAKLGSTIGGILSDLTVESIGKQIGYVISYHHNLSELKKALGELNNRREGVQHMVDEAQRQGEEIHAEVKDWISGADEITKNAEEVCAKGCQDCSWRSCPNLWLRHQISREAKKMTIQIQKHKDDGKFDKVSHPILPELVGVPPTSEENDEGMESKISIRNQVLEELKNPNNDMVGLFGMPGVGKTTLAKQIARIANKEKFFGTVVWVEVRQDGHEKLKDLQTQVAESVGKKLGEETLNARANILLQLLKDKQRVLVVLDDLWERLDLGLLGIPPAVDRKKNKWKILMTSRNVELLNNQMGCTNNFEVDLLTEEEAWKLFKDNAKLDESNHRDQLVRIAKDVCQRCGGLPLALVAVARALKNRRDESDWRNALTRLHTLSAWDTEIGRSLRLSYEFIEDPELKSIFLLTAILSHDPLINELLRYVVSLDLLEGVHSMEQAYNALGSRIRDLKASSLLLDSYSDDRVTMHDLFRDFALFKVPESGLVRLKGGQDDLKDKMTQLKGCTRLVLDKWDETLPDELPCPNLQFFLLNGEGSELKIPEFFLKSLNDLKAVRFTRVEFSSTLGHLKELRMLWLESCAILSDISLVGNLKSLRVLSFARSEIRELPRELRQLTCLQVLDLSSCGSLEVIPPTVLSSLKKLEVLNMKDSFSQWEAEGSTKVNKNASLDELKQLTKLYDLSIRIPKNLVLPEDLFNGMPLKRYEITYGSRDGFWTDCSRNLEMSQVSLGGVMQKLLEKVQYLFLSDVKVKINVLGGTLLPPHCVGLKHLVLRSCESLKAIVGSTNKDSIDDVIVFHALRTLRMTDMPNLSAFYVQEEEINAKSKSLFNSKISFPKIEELDISDLNRMISSIWDDDQLPENSFTNLKTLEVLNCGFAGRLVPFHVLNSLKHLERVEVGHCDKVEVVFDFEELNGEEIQSPFISVPLKKLSLYKLPALKHVWSNWPQETVSFPCLEEVEIYECERLTSMSPSSQLQEEYHLFPHRKVVQNMKRLTCDGTFKKMVWDGQIPDNYFSSLEHLSLYLDDDDESVNTTFPRGLDQRKFPNLQTLVLKGYMKELLFSSSCPKPPLDDEVGAPFTTLAFDEMYNLEHIWNENTQSVFLLQNPQTLRVSHCDNLINLGTSFISFTNLTEIQVSSCGKMISLLTSSASRGMVQLTKLTITNCYQMKEVVAEQQLLEKDDDDLSGRETIVFQKLEYLELNLLRSLRSFCNYNYTFKFPSLGEVIITRCPGMIMFCQGDVHTPHLKGVTFDDGEPHWEGSLNKTIQYIWESQIAKVRRLELCPEMRSVWMEQYPQRSMAFSRLEELTIDRCDFLLEFAIPTHLVRSLSITLQRLEVCNCQYIKAIFGPIMDDEGEAHFDDGSKCFQSLRKIEINECKNLEYIFMASSVAMGLVDESIEESPNFVFPHLESLRLEKLHGLKGFCRQRCTFEWPRLTELWVLQCENLKVFGTEMTSITESGEKDEFEDLQTPLFLAEKVIPNLNTLSLSQKDVALIKNHQFETNLFDKVWYLTLGGLFGESAAAAASFPYDFIERFPNLSTLGVEHSDFEEIFSSQPQQRAFSCSLEGLWLSCLDQLNTIWNDDDDDDSSSQSQPLDLTSLEALVVECCCNLIKLIPSSASLGNLTQLEVSGCHQLIYLFTYSTAKSLVNLFSLNVIDCKKIKEILRNESEEDAVVGGGGGAGITFNRLWKLELDALPSLEGFCLKNQTFKFPILRYVAIKGCHQMKMFSLGVSETPDLRNVMIDDIRMRLNEDLNRTVEMACSSHTR